MILRELEIRGSAKTEPVIAAGCNKVWALQRLRGSNRDLYDGGFFSQQSQGALESARIVVPLVMALLRPERVIDVGCGHGAWLRAFVENGVAMVQGMDGEYVERSRLMIDSNCFVPVDLARPFIVYESFDLAVCLEVAEHVPARSGRTLVKGLTEAAPVVLFSAAVPGQGGRGHLNEQWPGYWRALFAERGFRMLDPIRPRIRDDPRVEWFYRQNILVFASEAALLVHPSLKQIAEGPPPVEIEWLHANVVMNRRRLSFLMLAAPQFAWRKLVRLFERTAAK